MGYSIGFDSNTKRDIGYGVPAVCDHPGCKKPIDRGLGHMCGGLQTEGKWNNGCGLFFCGEHLRVTGVCARCSSGRTAFKPKADVDEWLRHKLADASWGKWRKAHPVEVENIRRQLARRKGGADVDARQ
jgi:hypothetical protein